MSTTVEQSSYDSIADDYAQSTIRQDPEAFHFTLDLVIPRLLEVAGHVDGLAVLDAGCGEGIVSRSLLGRPARVIRDRHLGPPDRVCAGARSDGSDHLSGP